MTMHIYTVASHSVVVIPNSSFSPREQEPKPKT